MVSHGNGDDLADLRVRTAALARAEEIGLSPLPASAAGASAANRRLLDDLAELRAWRDALLGIGKLLAADAARAGRLPLTRAVLEASSAKLESVEANLAGAIRSLEWRAGKIVFEPNALDRELQAAWPEVAWQAKPLPLPLRAGRQAQGAPGCEGSQPSNCAPSRAGAERSANRAGGLPTDEVRPVFAEAKPLPLRAGGQAQGAPGCEGSQPSNCAPSRAGAARSANRAGGLHTDDLPPEAA